MKGTCASPKGTGPGPMGKTASWIQRREKAVWAGPGALENSAGEPCGGDPRRHLVGFLSPATLTASGCPWLMPGAQDGEKAAEASPAQPGLVS